MSISTKGGSAPAKFKNKYEAANDKVDAFAPKLVQLDEFQLLDQHNGGNRHGQNILQ